MFTPLRFMIYAMNKEMEEEVEEYRRRERKMEEEARQLWERQERKRAARERGDGEAKDKKQRLQ